MNVLEAKIIEKTYEKQTTLNDVDFSTKKGEISALLGPNGADWTTLIKIKTSFLIKESSRVEILGHDLDKHKNEICHVLGYVGQDTEKFAKRKGLKLI